VNALLLTAGLGTRLDPLTRLVAKPAVPLGDRSLVEHVIAWVRRQGVTDLVMNLHHHPASLTAVVGDGRHLGVRVRYSWERTVLGSAGGPRRALPLIDSDPFLLVNGDTLCDFDLAPMIAAHRATDAAVTLAVVPNPAPRHYNGIVARDDGAVTGFVPRGQAEGSWHFVGVQIAQAHVFADLPDGVPIETVAGIYREIVAAQSGRLRVWHAPTDFIDVGTPRDYLSAAARLGATRASDARPHVNGTVIWAGASVHHDAELADCIVAGPVRIPGDFRASSSILMPAALARAGDHVDIRGDVACFPLDSGPQRGPSLGAAPASA
jgi:NDP-sugar pyrophosphorylase family protein